MDRDRIAWRLDHHGEAYAACRRAVLGGAPFWVTEHIETATTLVAIYTRRDRHTRQRAIPTLAFAQAVNDLRARSDDLVRLSGVVLDGPPYHFQVFLNEDATAVVACLGVDQSWNPRHPTERPPADATGSLHDAPPDPR